MTNTPNDPFAQTPSPSQQPPSQPQADPASQPGHEQYAQPGYGPDPRTQKNWMGITSLVLSLTSLIFGITAIGGIILGHMSLSAVKRGEANNRGLGLAGLIIGYVFLALGIIATVGTILFFGWFMTECGATNAADWCTA